MPASKNVNLANDPGTRQEEAGFGYYEGFFFQSTQDGLVAKAGGGISGATQFPAMFNRVATVATAGDSCVLPPAWQGLSIAVLNDSASNSMQVFAQGTDTINSLVPGATGIAQMPKSLVWYTCHSDGNWVANGIGNGYGGAYPTWSTQNNITATPSGTQANSVGIAALQAQITTAALGSGVTLMPAIAGMEITVVNNGANAVNVFPASAAQGGVTGGDKINSGAQNASASLAAGSITIYFCFTTGVWITK